MQSMTLAPFITNFEYSVTGKFITSFETYVNPLPTGLVLTSIVVGVSVTAVMLALTYRIYKRYHTLNLNEVFAIIHKEEEERL